MQEELRRELERNLEAIQVLRDEKKYEQADKSLLETLKKFDAYDSRELLDRTKEYLEEAAFDLSQEERYREAYEKGSLMQYVIDYAYSELDLDIEHEDAREIANRFLESFDRSFDD